MVYPVDTPRQRDAQGRSAVATPINTNTALLALKPKDRLSEVILSIVRESSSELTGLAYAHEEAILNSLAASPNDNFLSAQRPYGVALWGSIYEDRVISNIVCPFTNEQVSAITTRLSTPLMGQREILYVEPQGSEDVRKARVRERLFDRAIHSPFTNWAALVWQTMRDVSVRSRGYMEVRHLLQQKKRRRYEHMTLDQVLPPEEAMQLAPEELAMTGPVRLSTFGKPITIWDGPIIRPLPFGTVHKPKEEPFIHELTPYVVVERRLPLKSFIAEAERMFSKKLETTLVPWNEADFRATLGEGVQEAQNSYAGTHERIGLRYQYEAEPTQHLPRLYEPVIIHEFRGIDPLGDPQEEIIAWSVNGACVGAKVHDGSGSAINVIEFVWDPMNGFATSAGPAVVLRRTQEMLNLLWSSRLDQTMWEGHPAGLIDPMAVDIEIVRKIRPGKFGPKRGEQTAVEWFQLGRNSQATSELITRTEDSARLATGGTAAVVGQPPPGVSTATEFSGVSRGAFDRIGAQQEINADALGRLFRLVVDDWRDSLPTDEDLQVILGDNADTQGATLADLDGELDVIPMASRYQATNVRELGAIKTVKDLAAGDPALMARLKPEMDDDLVQAAAGPRGRRWVKSDSELMMEGIDPKALVQMRLQGAQTQATSGKGTASPPRDQAEQPIEQMPVQTPGG